MTKKNHQYELMFSKAAVHDLIRLRKFIEQHNPSAAQRISKRLQGAIQGLLDTPQIGKPVDNIPGEIREFIFGKYIIRYKVHVKILYILRIWHGKEDR
ncbi:MAG: type II toxin-antitoxin system RelE/ParE family toxin [bacterium]|nr:type II toxin-antitoxin system RelE/ParE family toxin [bacterium]